MKRIILVKTSRDPQVAHLYEHLYCRALFAFFSNNHLFDYLDYTFQGTTYDNGLVHIEIYLYSPEAERVIGQLSTLAPSFTDEAINKAMAQIIAEEKHYLGGHPDRLAKKLQVLQAKKWQKLDAFTIFDSRGSHTGSKALWISEKAARTKLLRTEFILDSEFAKKHTPLLPLFEIVASILQDNLTRELTYIYGYYRGSHKSVYNSKINKNTYELSGWVRYVPMLTDELKTSKSALAELVDRKILHRTSDFLVHCSYSHPYQAPDELKLFDVTKVLVGGAGWRGLATEKNIFELLRHTSFQLTYGKEKQQMRLSDIIKLAPEPK